MRTLVKYAVYIEIYRLSVILFVASTIRVLNGPTLWGQYYEKEKKYLRAALGNYRIEFDVIYSSDSGIGET